MGGPRRDRGVSHFTDGVEMGGGWRENQAVLSHAFGDGRVGTGRELAQNLRTETAISFLVAALGEQRGEAVISIVVGGHQFDYPVEVRNGRRPLSTASVNDAKHVEKCRGRGMRRKLTEDFLRFLKLFAAYQKACLSELRPDPSSVFCLLSQTGLFLLGGDGALAGVALLDEQIERQAKAEDQRHDHCA